MAKPTEVELTSKTWKLQILLSSLTTIVCLILGFVGVSMKAGSLIAIGFLGFVVGLVWFIVARVMAWWHHG